LCIIGVWRVLICITYVACVVYVPWCERLYRALSHSSGPMYDVAVEVLRNHTRYGSQVLRIVDYCSACNSMCDKALRSVGARHWCGRSYRACTTSFRLEHNAVYVTSCNTACTCNTVGNKYLARETPPLEMCYRAVSALYGIHRKIYLSLKDTAKGGKGSRDCGGTECVLVFICPYSNI
jgi:hypothetical protein